MKIGIPQKFLPLLGFAGGMIAGINRDKIVGWFQGKFKKLKRVPKREKVEK